MEFLHELWLFIDARKKYRLLPLLLVMAVFGCASPWLGCGTLHLHAALTVRILGISAFYHDSAAAIVVDGRLIAAAQEERFTRRKHDARFPRNAVAYCLAQSGCRLSELDNVVFYDKPFLRFERL